MNRNMSFTRGWIIAAAESLNMPVIELSTLEARELLRQLRMQFSNGDIDRYIWEDLVEPHSSIRWADGWRKIGEYVDRQPCILVVPNENCAFRVRNGDELNAIIGECPLFEYFVTDENRTYLMCHNHHDYLIGVGNAASWVGRIVRDEASRK